MNEKDLGAQEDLGANLHTALRKCCDSEPTSLAYNLISMEAFTPAWLQYLNLVIEQGAPYTIPKLQQAAKDLGWGSAESNALRLVFGLLSDDDWAGFIAFQQEVQEEQ